MLRRQKELYYYNLYFKYNKRNITLAIIDYHAFSSHNVAHILIRTCIVLWSSAMLFLDFVPWPSRSLPHLAYSPWFFFSANSLTSFRSFCLRSPVWVLLRPCTQVLLTRYISLSYFSLCHHLFLDHKFPTTSFLHGRMMSPPRLKLYSWNSAFLQSHFLFYVISKNLCLTKGKRIPKLRVSWKTKVKYLKKSN